MRKLIRIFFILLILCFTFLSSAHLYEEKQCFVMNKKREAYERRWRDVNNVPIFLLLRNCSRDSLNQWLYCIFRINGKTTKCPIQDISGAHGTCISTAKFILPQSWGLDPTKDEIPPELARGLFRRMKRAIQKPSARSSFHQVYDGDIILPL